MVYPEGAVFEKRNMPVFPNIYPFNNMIFDGHMKVGDYDGVKTRNWNWAYRGPVLFYNSSSRVCYQAMRAYGYEKDKLNHKVIIGVGELAEVRALTNQEAKQMVCNFNNITLAKLNRLLAKNGYTGSDSAFWVNGFGYIAPLPVGFFFKNLKRFGEPVPFKWPAGPVKPIFINPWRNPKLGLQLAKAGY